MSVYKTITVADGLIEINPLIPSPIMTEDNVLQTVTVEVAAEDSELEDSEIKAKVCQICHSSFKRADHLKRHIQNLHSNQNFYRCPICDQDCESKETLDVHVKENHSDVDIFPCRACGLKCLGISVLIEHEKGHNSAQILCPHCQAPFKRRDHMLRHARSQHFKCNVQCPVCKQYYKRKDHLVRHVREKHKMLYLNGTLIKCDTKVVDK